MKKQLLAVAALLVTYAALSQARVGIGTTTPLARLHVTDSNVVFSASGGVVEPVTADVAISGQGRRLLWYPEKAAFRVGYVGGNQWDKGSIGSYSFAAGINVLASGVASVAIGHSNIAMGLSSTALGEQTKASGPRSLAAGYLTTAQGFFSTALGYNTEALGDYSTAIGNNTNATGNNSTATGGNTTASGNYSTAFGYNTEAEGEYSTALGSGTHATGINSTATGLNTRASGHYSTAMGAYASTSGYSGSFVIGDGSSFNSLVSFAPNQMSMRFAGGYYLFSSADYFAGVHVSAGGGSWSSISDSNRKENFRPMNFEDVLLKVAAMPISNWNYKTQPATQRHIGPVAQDFYAAFQLDGIGNDTTINTVDIDGVNMIAIQALEKRTVDLKTENEILKKQNEALATRLEKIESLLAKKR